MWYYIKQSFLPFVYLFFVAMSGFGVVSIGDHLLALKILLALLNLAMYLVIVCGAAYKDGQTAYKTMLANDLERIQIIKTGEDRPLKLKEEYKWWKGYLYGFIACVPLLILLLIHTILILINPTLNGAGVIAGLMYLAFFLFFRLKTGVGMGDTAVIAPSTFYFSLIALPIIMLASGIPYVLGAKKIKLQQERIKAKQREIYGE